MEKLKDQIMDQLGWGSERADRALRYMLVGTNQAGLENMSLNDLVDHAQVCEDLAEEAEKA